MLDRLIDLSVGEKMITVTEAAIALGKSPDTIRRYAIKYGIGRQLEKNASWSVSLAALRIIYAKDSAALAAYRSGEREHPRLGVYFDADT
ncbi:hypothetical protein [Phyllobacterium lublinensis]|uniref:hypothetical protein n=1 Tax=Phyllobacterium lublinensis TaxID=2875708 RepID=UPI001CCDC8CC|nr:hypothetical protein [Phyllobacterium sp. 2063]MBZ9655041.1 hypothetical protein [Phyllobacterium sp. 2063]